MCVYVEGKPKSNRRIVSYRIRTIKVGRIEMITLSVEKSFFDYYVWGKFITSIQIRIEVFGNFQKYQNQIGMYIILHACSVCWVDWTCIWIFMHRKAWILQIETFVIELLDCFFTLSIDTRFTEMFPLKFLVIFRDDLTLKWCF